MSRYFYEVRINAYSRNSSKWSTVANMLNLVVFYENMLQNIINRVPMCKQKNYINYALQYHTPLVEGYCSIYIKIQAIDRMSHISNWSQAIANHKIKTSKTLIHVYKIKPLKAKGGEKISVWKYKQTYLPKKLACQETSFTHRRGPFTWSSFC